MIDRYTRKEMGRIWSLENKFKKMMDVEIEVARVQAKHKMIPRKAALDIASKAKVNPKRILEIEKTTKHDVIAFVSNMAESVGPSGKYIHYGLTSSDVLDTATGLLIKESGEELSQTIENLDKVLRRKAKHHLGTLCAGRTHGMHAETTSFGMKLMGYVSELGRHQVRLRNAFAQASVGKLSGAVGTFSQLSEKIESEVCHRLDLLAEPISTQVIPRDRHAEVFCALALWGGFLERLAVELRHLQRTEIGEVVEDFSVGQKGSSAMPHKKNPISAENITGAARLLRAYQQAAMENMSLWHERDISHSSVERVILPDAMILSDYATDRMTQLISRLYVDKERMRQNMNLSRGQLMSSTVLLRLVESGLSREEAYGHVQRVSLSLKSGEHLKAKILKDGFFVKQLGRKVIESVFKESNLKSHFTQLAKRVRL